MADRGRRVAEGRAARFAALTRGVPFAGAFREERYCFVCTAILRMTFSSTVTPIPAPVGTLMVPSARTVNGSAMISVAK